MAVLNGREGHGERIEEVEGRTISVTRGNGDSQCSINYAHWKPHGCPHTVMTRWYHRPVVSSGDEICAGKHHVSAGDGNTAVCPNRPVRTCIPLAGDHHAKRRLLPAPWPIKLLHVGESASQKMPEDTAS